MACHAHGYVRFIVKLGAMGAHAVGLHALGAKCPRHPLGLGGLPMLEVNFIPIVGRCHEQRSPKVQKLCRVKRKRGHMSLLLLLLVELMRFGGGGGLIMATLPGG